MMVIGPIVRRDGGYAFDTAAAGELPRKGFVYRRIEDARYARNKDLSQSGLGILVCETLADFISELSRSMLPVG